MAMVKIKAGKLRRRDRFNGTVRKPSTPDSNGNRAERREAAKKKR